MNGPRALGKLLLWVHLFVCFVWLYLFRSTQEPPAWTLHVFALSILVIQFTWGITIGLLVGPSRKDRGKLWWSLLTVFMPMWVCGLLIAVMANELGPVVALLYLLAFTIIVASETYCGVLIGAKAHADSGKD